ncbi:MAG: AAA family ATPase [Fimbriimonas sp.]
MTPSSLDALAGLRTAKRVVRRLVADQGAGHAVLLYGAPGSGKNALARMLVQAWLCQRPGPEGADGTCQSCGAFGRGSNSDFLLVQPQGNSRIIPLKAIAPSADQKADDPPHVQEFFRTLPLLSRHKVVLIEDADRMNASAFNSLLKTLEEPLPHARLVLTTPQIGALPATILSRCLALACEAPGEDELRSLFPDATEEEIRLAEGTPGRLAAILARREMYGQVLAYAKRLRTAGAPEALVASEGLRRIGDAIDDATGCGVRAANAEALSLLAICLARDPEAPPEWTQYVTEAHRRIVGNGSPPVVFDALLARMLVGRRGSARKG